MQAGVCTGEKGTPGRGTRRGLAGTAAQGPGRQARGGPGRGHSAPTALQSLGSCPGARGHQHDRREPRLRVHVTAGAEVGRRRDGVRRDAGDVEEAVRPSWVGRPEQGDGGEEHHHGPAGPPTPVPDRLCRTPLNRTWEPWSPSSTFNLHPQPTPGLPRQPPRQLLPLEAPV